VTNEGPLLTPTDMVPTKKLDYILDPKELQSFAIQIARGMAHLEMKQITHRYFTHIFKTTYKSMIRKQNVVLFMHIMLELRYLTDYLFHKAIVP
jgi:hypothetical protein